MVNLSIDIDTSLLSSYEPDEDLFASVTVTDVSSLQNVPSHKLQPSLPSMVYLENEVKLVGTDYNSETGALEYSDEFIDSEFNLDATDNTGDYSNLELLLGV